MAQMGSQTACELRVEVSGARPGFSKPLGVGPELGSLETGLADALPMAPGAVCKAKFTTIVFCLGGNCPRVIDLSRACHWQKKFQ